VNSERNQMLHTDLQICLVFRHEWFPVDSAFLST
jgi:hypothetical protein